jgi:transposase
MYINEGKGPKEIASSFLAGENPVKVSTVAGIIKTFKKENRINKKHKGGRNHQLIYNDDDFKIISDIQSEHNEWTYKQIREEWRARTNKTGKLSNSIIHKALEKYEFTTKNLEREPPQRNSPANIEIRKEYCLRASEWKDNEVIFIDEKGFDLHSFRRRGRNFKGKRALVIAKSSQGTRISICAALSPIYGIMAYSIEFGTFDEEKYLRFLEKLFKHNMMQNQSFHLIMDNGPAHRPYSISNYINEEQKIQHFCEKLPPYSPQINAIEYCFAKWAHYVNTRLKSNQQTLLKLIEEAIAKTTIADCAGYVRQVTRHYVHCSSGQPLNEHPQY